MRHHKGTRHSPCDHGDRGERGYRDHYRHMRPEGRHGRGGHGRGGGGRMFEHGAMRWLLLSLIAEKPSHGYELIKEIEARVGGAYAPSPGVIYPSLTLLEDMGALTIEVGEGGKKLHIITDEGRRILQENTEILARTEARMAGMRDGEGRPAPVRDAIEALRDAVKERVRAEPRPEPETLAQIIEILRQAEAQVRQA